MKDEEETNLPGVMSRLAVRKLGEIELVPVAQVFFVQGADNYVELVLRNGRRELYDTTLARITAILPTDFVRIHKCFLVRLSAVQRIQILGGSQYKVELADGTLLPVGRTRYPAIRAKLLGDSLK